VALACAGLAGLAAPQRLHAQDAPLLTWSAPESCPSRTLLEAEIERILGRRPEGGPFADVTVTARGGRHVAVLAFGPSRRRRIEGASCEAIVRAAALILALEIDPDALSLDVAEPQPEPVAPAPEPPIAELEGHVDPSRALTLEPARELASPFAPGAPRGPVEPPFRFSGGAAMVLDAGAMPGLAPGFWVGAMGRVAGLVEIGLELRYLPEQRARLAPRPQVGADVSMLAGRVRLGVGLVVARLDAVTLEVAPLAALELGSVSASAVGLMEPLSSSSLWWAVDAGLELRAFFLDAIGVFLRGEVEVTLRRSAFFVEGYTTPVFRAADAGFVGAAGLLFRTS
jgi:hypothetical protein